MTAPAIRPQSYLALIHRYGAVFDADANAWDVMAMDGEVRFSLPGTFNEEALNCAVDCYERGLIAGRADGTEVLQRTLRAALGIMEHR